MTNKSRNEGSGSNPISCAQERIRCAIPMKMDGLKAFIRGP